MGSTDRLRARTLALFGAASVAAAVVIAVGIPIVFGAPSRLVHLEWRAGSERERPALEDRFKLWERTQMSERIWSYLPLDTSSETLRAIVTSPAIESTNGIDRNLFVLSDDGPLTGRRGGLIAAPRRVSQAAKLAEYVFGAAGIALLTLAGFAARGMMPRDVLGILLKSLALLSTRLREHLVRTARAAGRVWSRCPPVSVIGSRILTAAQRGIPVASAEAAGLFRIVFGSIVLLYVMSQPVRSSLLSLYELPRAEGAYGVLMRWLTANPDIVDRLDTAIAISGVLFVAGVATSVTYVAFVVVTLVWASVASLNSSHHVVSILSVALIALIPAPWGDALSVDSLMTRGSRASAPSRRYGFAMWAPLFVFSVGFAAAAWSKLRQGPGWILDGTVKYHFITDFDQAFVSWGLQLTGYPWLAIFLSAAAVVVELLVITAAFSRSSRYRAFWGAASLAMLAGFGMFQGVVWPGWWILLLGFLPWERFRSRAGAGVPGSLGFVQLVFVAVVVVQQLYASWARVEARPLISAYDMYSTTYASPAAYEAAGNLVYRVVGITSTGTEDLPDCTIDEPAAQSFALAADGNEQERQRMRGLIGECLLNRPDVLQVSIEGDKEVFDWDERRFAWRRNLDKKGPVDASWLHVAAEDR